MNDLAGDHSLMLQVATANVAGKLPFRAGPDSYKSAPLGTGQVGKMAKQTWSSGHVTSCSSALVLSHIHTHLISLHHFHLLLLPKLYLSYRSAFLLGQIVVAPRLSSTFFDWTYWVWLYLEGSVVAGRRGRKQQWPKEVKRKVLRGSCGPITAVRTWATSQHFPRNEQIFHMEFCLRRKGCRATSDEAPILFHLL